MEYEQLVKKAEEGLKSRETHNADSPIFRAIGYAILALAAAVRDKND